MSITRRGFIKGAAMATAATTFAPAALAGSGNLVKVNKPSNPKNILIITADQLARKAVSGYGNDFVKTPAIDSLINKGVKFTNTYCTYPLCAPSRASYWTGNLPHQTGVIANSSPNIPETMNTLGRIFSTAGYDCQHFGKQHDYGSLDGFNRADQVQLKAKSSEAFPANYDSNEDVYCLQEAVKYLNNYDGSKPFLMAVEFNNPHNICGWVGKFQGEHGEIEGIGTLPPLPDNYDTSDDLMNRSKSVQYACCTHNRLRQASQWSDLNFRQYLKAYYHYVEMADNCISQVLDALKAKGLEDETLVVFHADHGDSMGAHRLVTKMNWFYDESTNVPLVIAGKGFPKGKTLQHLTSLADILPTLCEYVGLPVPQNIYGSSLISIIKDKDTEWRNEVVCQWHTNRSMTIQPARMMRTSEFKYIVYREEDDEELYDMVNDSGETVNLAKQSEYADVLKKLRIQFNDYVRNSVDPFFTQEAIIDKRWRTHKCGYNNHEGDSSIDVYLRTIRPMEKSGDVEGVNAAKKSIVKNSRLSYYK